MPRYRLGICALLLSLAGHASATEQPPMLHIAGSNTLGAQLMPALVSEMLQQEGFTGVRTQRDLTAPLQQRVTATQGAHAQYVSIVSEGSGTGFVALSSDPNVIAASSRLIKAAEASDLQHLGDLTQAQYEHVIALDGLAIIVHPDNPVRALNTEQLAQIYAGKITHWHELGGDSSAIQVHARDDQSGTYDTFKELVLSPNKLELGSRVLRYASNSDLRDAVLDDPAAIGFVSLSALGKARALAIADGDAQPMEPSQLALATEDYPLTRRLFLYSAAPNKPWTKRLLEFAHSPNGQAVVERTGFVPQRIEAVTIAPQPDMPVAYRELASEAQRLTVNFRFLPGSAELDNKAKLDIQRAADWLKQQGKDDNKAVLVGFGDAHMEPSRARLISKLRAMAVRRELSRAGVFLLEVDGLGDALPVASQQGSGRTKNQRVEIWVR